MHTPVLLHEVIDGLQVRDGGRYIDATVGEGGHTKAMLERGAYVLGMDQDKEQIEKLKQISLPGRLTLVHSNFSHLEDAAKKAGFAEVDGILFDLGLSWGQLSASGKGLTFKNLAEPLDMRLSEECELTAADILMTYSQEELYSMLAKNSEEIRSQVIADTIIEMRKRRRISTVGDFRRVIDRALNEGSEISYSRLFQALRIEVNHEFQNLISGLEQAAKLINTNGRIAVITFHSVEDRMVKRFIREGKFRQIQKKAIAGDRNLSFERSAKLRIFGV